MLICCAFKLVEVQSYANHGKLWPNNDETWLFHHSYFFQGDIICTNCIYILLRHRRRKGMTAATGCLASLAQIQIHTCTNTQIQILKYKFSNRQQKKPTITGWGRAPLCPENPSPIKRQLERQRQWQWQRQIQKQSPGRKGRASATGCLGQPVGSTLTPEPLH